MKQMRHSVKKAKGFTLVELLIGVAVLMFIATLMAKKGDYIWDSLKIWQAKNQVTEVSRAVQEYTYGNDIRNVSMPNLEAYLPEDYGTGVGANAFKGDILVQWAGTGLSYNVTMTGIPTRSVTRFANGYTNSTPNVAAKSVTITLGN